MYSNTPEYRVREQWRKDFSNPFLTDLLQDFDHGYDPYNHIGLDCGFSNGRAMQIGMERAFEGEL